MAVLQLTGWRTGFEKIRFQKHLRGATGLSLARAHAVVEKVLDGQLVEVPIDGDADELAERCRELGVDCRVLSESTTDG